MVNLDYLRNRLSIVASNFNFDLDENFGFIANVLLSKINSLEESFVDHKFSEVLLISQEEWNRKYGYKGYPALNDWIKMLTGESCVSQQEAEKRIKQIKLHSCCKAKAISLLMFKDHPSPHAFIDAFKNPDKKHLKRLLEKHFNIIKELDDVELINLSSKLRKQIIDDEDLLKKSIKEIYLKEHEEEINKLRICSNQPKSLKLEYAN